MSKPIESDALDRLYRVLGLSGGALTKGTLLDDGNVSQVLSINEIVRRSRTPAATTGWYRPVFENVHAAASDEQSNIDPYAPGAVAFAPYPNPVPRGFDFWILGASLRRTSGAGTLTNANLGVRPVAAQFGWGIDEGGVQVSAPDNMVLAAWTSLNTGSIIKYGTRGNGDPYAHINLRVPRGTDLFFTSTAAGAAATFRCYLIAALFPEGLGQDVAQ